METYIFKEVIIQAKRSGWMLNEDIQEKLQQEPCKFNEERYNKLVLSTNKASRQFFQNILKKE